MWSQVDQRAGSGCFTKIKQETIKCEDFQFEHGSYLKKNAVVYFVICDSFMIVNRLTGAAQMIKILSLINL